MIPLLLAVTLTCTSPAWQLCHHDNVYDLRIEQRNCQVTEIDRVAACIGEAQTELSTCRDPDVARCLELADQVEANCRRTSTDYRDCRRDAREFFEQMETFCVEHYPCN